MNLLEGILKKKKNLTLSSTTITTVTGNKFLETSDSLGYKSLQEIGEKSSGFVVDEKPDLQVAQALPFLYFGSQDVATDEQLLNQFEITHILSLGVKLQHHFNHISYEYIELLDIPEANLLSALAISNDLIEHIRKRPPSKLFVHCNAGCSRAPSIVLGYIMFFKKMSFLDAFNTLKEVRYIRPNERFVHQLRVFSKSLDATLIEAVSSS